MNRTTYAGFKPATSHCRRFNYTVVESTRKHSERQWATFIVPRHPLQVPSPKALAQCTGKEIHFEDQHGANEPLLWTRFAVLSEVARHNAAVIRELSERPELEDFYWAVAFDFGTPSQGMKAVWAGVDFEAMRIDVNDIPIRVVHPSRREKAFIMRRLAKGGAK